MKQEVLVKGMSCQGCANSVKTQFEKLDEVQSVKMDLAHNKAVLEVENELPKESLKNALADTNYKVV